jgi:alanine-synthesizing transaminase
MFSARARFSTEENAHTVALRRAREAGVPLLDLTVGDPTSVGLSPARAVLEAALTEHDPSRYHPASLGLPATRAAIADAMGCDPAQVIVTASTSEAYALVIKLLCDPGDSLATARPSYPLVEVLATLEGARVQHYSLRYDGAWYADAAEIEASIDTSTKALVAVSPNNPTGSYLDADTRDRMLDLGRPLIVDEVFAPFALEGAAPALAPATRGLVFRLSGLSKRVALPQLKLGFIVVEGAPALVGEALRRLEHMNDAFLSASTPTQLAAARLLARGPEVVRAITARCRANLCALDDALAGCPALSRYRVEAGWYAIIRLPEVESEEAWALALLEAGVVVQPGYLFDFEGGAHAVVSLITPEATLRAGLARLVERARALSDSPESR